MGKVFATCGHEIVNYPEDEVFLSVMEYARTGERAVSYETCCKPCAKMLEDEGLVLHNDQEIQDWFHGKIEMPGTE